MPKHDGFPIRLTGVATVSVTDKLVYVIEGRNSIAASPSFVYSQMQVL